MNTQEISGLLDKYYRGATTDDEENVLMEYFSKADIPDGLEAEKDIFTFYLRKGSIPVPSDGFENRIISAIDEIEEKNPVYLTRRGLYAVLSSAAAILMLIGSFFIFVNKTEPNDTFSDPAIAYAETLKILYSISTGLNRGIAGLDPVRKIEMTASESIGTVTRSAAMIDNNLKPLEYFQKAMNIVSSPVNINVNK